MKNLVRKAAVFLIKWLGGGDPASSVETALQLETRGYHADAEEMLIGAFKASPQRSTAVHLARVAFLRQDFLRVASTLKPFESELGTDAESLYRLGYSLLASGTGDGISQLRKAIELSRGTAKYKVALEAAIHRMGCAIKEDSSPHVE